MNTREFFEDVSDALVAFLPPSLRDCEQRRSWSNLKVWFPPEPKEHYEVQILRRSGGVALEVGFHAEHGERERNERTIGALTELEKRWRTELGPHAEAGPFSGQTKWRRLSEFWGDGEWAVDEATAVEAAELLATYIRTLEPLRRGR